MNTQELTMLLTRIQVLDNRQIDQLTIEAWADVLPEDLTIGDAVEAVNLHFRTSTEYLKPAHIVTLARDLRARRYRATVDAGDNAIRDRYAYAGEMYSQTRSLAENVGQAILSGENPEQIFLAWEFANSDISWLDFSRRESTLTA